MSNTKTLPPPGIDLEKGRVSFELIKGNSFRVIHADGVFGGIGPRGQLRMTFFNERWPIPTKMVHNLSEQGEIREEIREERESKNSIIREVEVEVVMDLDAAKNMLLWLQNHFTQNEKDTERNAAAE